MDPKDRFTAAASAYREHRPAYPAELIDWIAMATGVAPPARVADVGCGTGIASRLFAARGYEVIGVEPNDAMRAAAVAAGGARYRRGEATNTGLLDAAVDMVVCAQAFHYFEVTPTLGEWRRILAPGGGCAVFWYRIAASPLKDEYHALRRRHASAEPAPYRTRKKDIASALCAQPAVRDQQTACFTGEQVLDLDGLRGRFAASSHLAGAGDKALERAIADFFARHQQGGQVRLPLAIEAVAWRFEAFRRTDDRSA